MESFWRRLFSWPAICGVLLFFLGVDIIVTGRLRTVIPLGDEKYLIGGMCLLFGVYLLWLALFSDEK